MSQEQIYKVIFFQAIEIENFINNIGELESFFLGNSYDNMMELYKLHQQGWDVEYLSYDLVLRNNDIFMAFSDHPICLCIPNTLSDWLYELVDIDEYIYCQNEDGCQRQNYCTCDSISKDHILRLLPCIRDYSDLL
jgi:hypothetical protein